MNHPDEMLIHGFLNGIKDCILIHDEQLAQNLIDKRVPRKVYKRNFDRRVVKDYWFFKNTEVKSEFLKLDIHNKLKNGIFDHVSMGTILGFPPKSIEIFTEKSFLYNDKIGVSYCGMYYMSYKQSIEDDLNWLFTNRKPPENKGFEIELSFFDFDINKVLFYEGYEIGDSRKIINDVRNVLYSKQKVS